MFKKHIFIVVLALLLLVSCAKKVEVVKTYSGTVMMYSSLPAEKLQKLKKEFERKYEGVTLDFYAPKGGLDAVLTKVRTEMQEGEIGCDVFWFDDKNIFESLKGDGFIERYNSNENKAFGNEYIDREGFYTVACIYDDKECPIALVGNCKYEDNAKALIDFLLSKEGQESIKRVGFKATRKDIK